MNPARGAIDAVVDRALIEDRASEDITTSLLVPAGLTGAARIVAREPGTVSGQDCSESAFRKLDPDLDYRAVVADGYRTEEGGTVAVINGSLAAIISAERTALNLLGHLSGIATRTSRFVEKAAAAGIRILDTRKTIPGLRELEKRAVVHGGGVNHRSDLASYILVKENHIRAAGGIGNLAPLLGGRLAESEIEVTSIDELRSLRLHPPGRVMLDNFSPADIADALREIESWKQPRPEIEVSGGISLDNIEEYALRGVDFISVGSLTSSARALDLSLLIAQGNEGE